MTLLRRGQSALVARQQAAASPEGAITYTRLAGGTVDLTGKAWVGRTAYARQPVADSAQAVVTFEDRDYLIPALDLGAEPARGDRVTEVVNGTTKTYEVMAQFGEAEWVYSDPGETVYRVHVKQVS